MSNFENLIQNRRSHRRFTDEPVTDEQMHLIMRAALMSPTSKGLRLWRFVVVTDKEKINAIAEAKDSGGEFISSAPAVVVVAGTPKGSDCWVEDCSIAAFAIMLQAEDIGLGTCWVQLRDRGRAGGESANESLHKLLSLPDDAEVLCAIAVGHKADERKPQNEERLKWDSVAYE